ncbi:unnamed protein product [Urochloa humidicola]
MKDMSPSVEKKDASPHVGCVPKVTKQNVKIPLKTIFLHVLNSVGIIDHVFSTAKSSDVFQVKNIVEKLTCHVVESYQ